MFALTIFSLIVLVFSIMIHEIAHGSVALYLGDHTAKNEGRLTLNPLKHLDPFGSIVLPLLLLFSYAVSGISGPIVGWAKPIPVNPRNFRDKKWGDLKVAVAGPLSNFAVAAFFALLIRFVSLPVQFSEFLAFIAFYNFFWGLFNLIPVPPLDGSHIIFSFFPRSWFRAKLFLNQYGLMILIFVIFFLINYLSYGAALLYAFASGDKTLNLLINLF